MRIVNRRGDITTSRAKFICHQTNCKGKMGSGVAKVIRTRFPEIYSQFLQFYDMDNAKLGAYQICDILEGNRNRHSAQYVVNLYAQDAYGYDGKRYTSYDAFLTSIESFRDLLKTNMGSYVYGYVDNPEPENTIKYPETTIAFPVNIGCKRGGADWQIIKRMIEMTFENMNVVIEYWDFDTPENENR